MTEKADICLWNDIADQFEGSLLIGNGGSIALSQKFSYSSLYQFGVDSGALDSPIQEIFKKFSKTDNFEDLLRKLWQANFINEKLDVAPDERAKVRKPYTDVRRALINTVKDIHPDQEQLAEGLSNIRQFCSRFTKIFTLNYDLTLSWATETDNSKILAKDFSDGFSSKKTNTKLNSFTFDNHIDYESIRIYYLHGNLCLCQTKAIKEEKKLISENKDDSLLNQLTDYWAKNDVQPLFICEGSSHEKKVAIADSNYLSAAYESLKSDGGESLVIFGWSMSSGDQHILDAIKHNPSYKRAAVSVFMRDKKYKNYMADAKQALGEIGIESVRFFDAESPMCWANGSIP